MYEKRSSFFKKLFTELDISFDEDERGLIEPSHVLSHRGKSLMVYFNEATSNRGAYFALNDAEYAGFKNWRWLEAKNERKEDGHLKMIPYPGEEHAALKGLLVYAHRNANA